MSTKPTLQELSPGEIIGSYEILRLIYKGGQASVYLARVHRQGASPIPQTLALLERCDQTGEQLAATLRAEQICALKVPNPEWDDHICDEHRFLKDDREGHPHLIRLFSPDKSTKIAQTRPELGRHTFTDTSGQKHPLHYLALTYLPGGSLKSLLQETNHRSLEVHVAVAIAGQVAEALQHLHTRLRLVHHDVSPSNILLKQPLSGREPRRPHCVLIDLAVADQPDRPQLSSAFGKSLYLPPERRNASSNENLSFAVDVYSLGAVLFEMLYGSIPASTDSVRRQSFQFTPVRAHLRNLPEELGDLLDLMLSHHPARRPPIQEVCAKLAAFLAGKPEPVLCGPLTPCDRADEERRKRRRSVIISGGAVAGFLTLALATTLAIGIPAEPTPAPEATVTPIRTAQATATPRPTLVPTATLAPAAPLP